MCAVCELSRGERKVVLLHLIDLDAVVGDVDNFGGGGPVEPNHARILVLQRGGRSLGMGLRRRSGRLDEETPERRKANCRK